MRRVYKKIKKLTEIFTRETIEDFVQALIENGIRNIYEIVNNLEQIKWYFDGRKISKLEKEVFLKELEKVEIKRELIEKWINDSDYQTKSDFINFISTNFELIFKIK